jgi:uncharacterized protein
LIVANSDSATQGEVFQFLGSPKTHGGADVKRFETHGAAVFLAGDRALKVKRAIRFPFLDYSTLDKRKAACGAELEINHNFAPQLYRRIVPITRESDGSLAIDGKGEPVEWAVDMARFDETMTLDLVAERGQLDDRMLGAIATAVAGMHERAPPADAAAWLDAVARYARDNTEAFRKTPELFPGAAVAELEWKSLAEFERLEPLLVMRGRQGLIRRGHGDLHLRNIAVLDGKPVAFDALEFDPVIASGDVLYDLAFLLMDLVERDLVRAANIVLNGYFSTVRRPDDFDGIAALSFFMSVRAAIRANVTAARLSLSPADGRPTIVRSARHYFDLALDLLAPVEPAIVCTAGLSGTGKSHLARELAPTLAPVPGALLFRSDVERKVLFDVAETDRLSPQAYRREVSASVYRILLDKAGRVTRAGHSVILDAVYAAPEERAAIEAVAATNGADFYGFFLVADLPTRLRRIGSRGPDASDADAEVARKQEEFDLGSIGWNIIDASGSHEETLARARAVIDRRC